jgi:acyl carrier protein
MQDSVNRTIIDCLNQKGQDWINENVVSLYSLGIDSIKIIKLIVAIEDKLGFEFSDEELESMGEITYKDFFALLPGN